MDIERLYDNYIELHVEGLTRGRELHHACILVLHEKNGNKFLPILLNHKGYEIVTAALQNGDFTPSHMMHQLTIRLGIVPMGIRIMRPVKGETQALIDFALTNEVVSMAVPIAEAVVAALEMRIPLWMERTQFARQTIRQPSRDTMALPLAAMTEQLLEEALQAAVEEENFELAGILHDELKKRSEE